MFAIARSTSCHSSVSSLPRAPTPQRPYREEHQREMRRASSAASAVGSAQAARVAVHVARTVGGGPTLERARARRNIAVTAVRALVVGRAGRWRWRLGPVEADFDRGGAGHCFVAVMGQ